MKKSTKLLSVILAIIMIFSTMSVAVSAATTSYKTVANLTSLNAYNDYGTVTRLSTEERTSILLDTLDTILANANINMGTVLDTLGLKITINLTSVDNLCASFDTFKSTMANGLYSIAKGVVDLGILEDVSFGSWDSGMSRGNNDQLKILSEVIDLLPNNTAAIESVLTNGIQLGMIATFIDGLDLSSINTMVRDLPGTIKGLIFPLFSRADDTSDQRTSYSNTSGNGGMLSVLDSFVQGIFSKPMNWTSYREDESGNDLHYTLDLPTTDDTSRYFVKDGDTITQWDYQYKNDDKSLIGTWQETVTYTKELEYEGAETYVYKAPEEYTGDANLKYYSAGDKGYFLPSVRDAVANGELTYSFNSSTDSAVSLLYKFIPYVFQEMAPTVLNGSVKKLLAGAFDVKFEKIGDKGSSAVADVIASVGDPDNFFTSDQEFYLWEYSDYKVINGVPYYRFQDEYFVGTIPSNISTYYYMFNWDWDITDDYINKYIPSVSGTDVSNSDAGYDTILKALNDFVYDVIDTVLVDEFTIGGKTYPIKTGMGWVPGDNSHALDNILRAARYVFNMAPEEIFDEYYNDPDFSPYYDMMMNGTLKQAVTGVLCAVIKMVMPQMILPKADKLCATVGTNSASDVPFVALGALVVRELCSQLMPSYDFDALLYADYSTKTLLTGEKYNADYWLDTVLTMGVDLGMFYLRNLTDIGEDDTTNGYYDVMKTLGALPSGSTADTVTYAAGATYIGSVPTWQYKVDWIIDWALTSDVEWGWNMGKLVDAGTVNLTSYQDPWAKLNTVILKLLPKLTNLLNDSDATATSNTFLEKILRDKLVGSILDLDLPNLVSTVNIPNGIFRNGNVLTQVVTVVRELLNGILYKIAGGTDLLSATTYTNVDAILNQTNIKSLAVSLVGKLTTAYDNGLLVTAMPFVNMFLGWTTDAQKYADPSIYFSSSSNDNYLLKTSTNILKFTNNSSGMLQTHRNSDINDSAYTINVTNVAVDAGSVSGFPCTVAPGGTADITITPPSGSGVMTFTITYSYTGKDGQALGGDQTKVCYAYYTETEDQENVTEESADTGDYASRAAYQHYVFTKDIYTSVTTYTGTMSYKAATVQIGNKTKNFVSCGVVDTAFNSLAGTYFTSITDRATAGWLTKLEKGNESYSSSVGKLYAAKSGVTSETFNEVNSVANNLYGEYNMGQVATKYGSKSGTWAVEFVYYNDYNISKVMDTYVNKNLQASNFTADGQSAFETYESALKTVVELTETPKLLSYTTVVQPYIEDAITALENAYEALTPYTVSAASMATSVNVTDVEDALNAIETDPSKDIDFEDHALFEYFQYEKQRTSAREMIKACKLPTEPESYIDGASLPEAAITEVVNANNENVATGISETIIAPTDEAMAAWNTAVAEFVAPVYSELQLDDQIAKIGYYAAFMNSNVRTANKNLLSKEIVAANAQSYDETYYSVDSWTAYETALADAVAVNNNGSALQSEVFDAKYALMEAQNDLIPAFASMKEDGYLDTELNGLISTAELIANSFDTYYTIKDGVAAADAWSQLVKALGVRYDVTVEGIDYEGILYDHSAYTFTDYDRLNTYKEKAKVDVACDALKAAIANFECKIKVVANDAIADNTTQVSQSEYIIDGVKPVSIDSGTAFKALVKSTAPDGLTAILTETASQVIGSVSIFGTGSKIVLSEATVGNISTYTLIIHGDVNGDSAVDAFDAFEVEKAASGNGTLAGAYKTAGDINSDDAFTTADYGAILSAAAGASELAQVSA